MPATNARVSSPTCGIDDYLALIPVDSRFP